MSVVQVLSAAVGASMSFQETITLGVNTIQQPSENVVPLIPGGQTTSYAFGNGTSTTGTVAGVVDLHFENSYTLASSASTTLVLSALTDSLGRTVAFARIRGLLIAVSAKTVANNDTLTVGNAGTHPWTAFLGGTTPTLTVVDFALLVANTPAGYAVSSGSSDQLKIVNSGSASMTFTVAILGCST